MTDVTQMLLRHHQGDEKALAELFPVVYDELRKIAAGYMRRESAGHTLQATALVNEAYFRLVDQKAVEWQNRAHFYGIAAQIMRRILVDHARARLAEKRGGGVTRLALDDAIEKGFGMAEGQGLWDGQGGPDLVLLDDALNELAKINARQAQVVEMRFFGGLSVEETAEALKTSPATVKRDWNFARAYLLKELTGTAP